MTVDSISIDDNSTGYDTIDATRMHGVVKWYNQSGHYGVIKVCMSSEPVIYKEYFVYVDDVISKLYDGIEVTFDAGYDHTKNRDIATNVSYRMNSSVNKDILTKINKIDMKLCISGCMSECLETKVHRDTMMLVLNTMPLDLPETFGDLFMEIMSLTSIEDANLNIQEIVSRGVHSFNIKLKENDMIDLGEHATCVPGCLNHTHDMLVSNIRKLSDKMIETMNVIVLNRDGVCIVFEYTVAGIVVLTSFGVPTELIMSSKHCFTKTSVQMYNGCSIIIGSDVNDEWKHMIKYPPIIHSKIPKCQDS